MYTVEHQNTQTIVFAFTNGLKFQWLNEIYSSSVYSQLLQIILAQKIKIICTRSRSPSVMHLQMDSP